MEAEQANRGVFFERARSEELSSTTWEAIERLLALSAEEPGVEVEFNVNSKDHSMLVRVPVVSNASLLKVESDGSLELMIALHSPERVKKGLSWLAHRFGSNDLDLHKKKPRFRKGHWDDEIDAIVRVVTAFARGEDDVVAAAEDRNRARTTAAHTGVRPRALEGAQLTFSHATSATIQTAKHDPLCPLWTAALDRLDADLQRDANRDPPIRTHRPLLLLYVFSAVCRGHSSRFGFGEYHRSVSGVFPKLTTGAVGDTHVPFWALSRSDPDRYWQIQDESSLPPRSAEYKRPLQSVFLDRDVAAIISDEFWAELIRPGAARSLHARIAQKYFSHPGQGDLLREAGLDATEIADGPERRRVDAAAGSDTRVAVPEARSPRDTGTLGTYASDRVVRPVIGESYRPADENLAASVPKTFAIDIEKVDRGVAGHSRTQNELAAWLAARGVEPRSPAVGEPNYDLLWNHESLTYVAEVKSITIENEEKQLRLGLGQVLRYRHLLELRNQKTRAVLVVESAPTDPTWIMLCTAHDVILAWPGEFNRALANIDRAPRG